MIEAILEIPVPADVAWRLLTYTEAWPRWGPSIRAVDAPARHISPGSGDLAQSARSTKGGDRTLDLPHTCSSASHAG